MPRNLPWTRQQLLVAFALYCRLPFGRLHRGNPEIIKFANAIGRSPSALAMKLTNIASLDPIITSSGRTGLRGASAADRKMWQEMEEDSASFAVECQSALIDMATTKVPLTGNTLDDENIYRVGEDRSVSSTVRIGQSFFRSAVLSAYNGRCCITGLSVSSLLVAGHIVPWSQDKRNRLNPRNGLALSVLHERAFDAGLVTINEDMTVQVSSSHVATDDPFFAISMKCYDGRPITLPQKFGVGDEFLAFHRENIFKK